jgi:patatin-like phospholipase/acyl hydrolase
MASTSAPTFFPLHEIKGLGNFMDGGLQANNPSRLALN